jgi:hypothetical protein
MLENLSRMGARHPKASILQPASHPASESDLPPIPAAGRLLRVRRPGARGGVLQAAPRVVDGDFRAAGWPDARCTAGPAANI